MERSGFFNSVNGDRKYKAEDFANYFNKFITNGVFPNPSTNLQVMAGDGMNVVVKIGSAWINGYVYDNTTDLILPVDPADGVLNRIDRVVLRYDTINREIKAKIKKGTFASAPVAPSLQRDADAFELALADISIAKGIVSISQAYITDTRLNTGLCGIVNSLIQVDTTTLLNQYEAGMQAKEAQFTQDFNDWFATIQAALDGDTAGNLLNLINNHKSDKNNPHEVTAAQIGAASAAELEALQEDVETHLADYALKGIYGDNGSGTKAVTNIDTITKSGYYVTADSITIDGKTDWWLINHMHNYSAPGYAFQIASSLQSAESQYARSQINGAWSVWKKLLNKNDYDVLFQYANDGKTGIANAVTAKGVSASPTDTFSVLATKIGQISTGKKVLSGTLTSGVSSHAFSKKGGSSTVMVCPADLSYSFGFTPSYVILWGSLGNTIAVADYVGSVVREINYDYNLNNTQFPENSATLTSTGFHLPVVSGGIQYTWVVVE